MMKKVWKRILFIFLAVVLLILLSGYIYVRTSVYRILDGKEREEIVAAIKSSPSLPERFYEIYNQVYPQSLERGQLYHILTRRKDGFFECPCRMAAYHLSTAYGLDLINITFWLEGQVTQRECLNRMVSQWDFLFNVRGLSEASELYFNKSIETLTDYEFVELAVMMRNPSYYNKVRFSERLEEKANELMNRIQ